MPDFLIKISTPADLTGAQATEIALGAIAKATGTVTTGAEQATQATGRFTDSTGRLREADGRFVAVGKSAQDAGKQIGEAENATHSFLAAFEGGIGIGIGEKALEGFSEIPAKFQEIMEKGVEYNAMMQSQAIGLGVSLRQMDPEKYLNFDTARTAGAETLDLLRTKANDLGLSFEELAHTFSVALPTLVEAGVTKTADQIDVLIRLQQMATKNGFTGGQATKDILDELLGRVERTNFGRELEAQGLTKKAIDDAKEAGTTAELILGKTSAMAEAAEAKADSYAGSLQTIHNQLDQLAGDVAKPAFDKLLLLLQGGKGGGGLGSAEASGMAQGIGNSLGGMIDGAENYAKSMEAFWERHPWLKKANEAVSSVMPENLLFKPFKDNIDAGVGTANVQAQDKQFKELDDKIANAHDDNAKAEARKALEEAIAAATERWAKATGDAKEDAKQYLDILTNLRDLAQYGSAPVDTSAADVRAKKAAAAEATYQNSPEKKLADAQASGDQTAINDAEYDAKVAKLAPQIEKKFPGLSPDQAEQHAEDEVGDADKQKDDQQAARDKARDEEKAKREAERAQKEAADHANAAAADARQRSAAISSEREEIAITQARAKGENDVADQLEKQRDIRRETERLQKEGLGDAEAHALAEEKVTAQIAEQAHKDDERAAKHRGTGGDGPAISYGYRDPIQDAPGQLHTGHLRTETLDGKPSADRFADVPDSASTALGNAPTAADALNAAPSHVSSFPSSSSTSGLISQLFGGDPLASLFGGSSTSTPALAPAFSSLSDGLVGRGGAGAGSDGGSATALTSVASSADALKTALDSAAAAANSFSKAGKSGGSGSGGGNSNGGGNNNGGYDPDFDSNSDGDIYAIANDQ